ncbi:MAG: FAD-binding protein [Opitutales bacterium]|nr:FAD-binding protein [Opitutales bacterium]
MKTNPNRRKKGTSELLKSLGPRKVFREGARKFMASFDGSKLSFEYDALIRARSEKDVQTTLRLANRYRIPVTTRGAGTSLTGSASPVNGGWVLDTSRMKRILIRKEKSMAIAQPGAVIGVLQKKAEEEGLFYPPDPSSLKYCTVGGNIACNAGGMRCAKYGVTRDFVVALEGFLPNGEKVTWGGEYKKFATGYNVRDLWIGSEGTLGVITNAVLKLLPKPELTWTSVAAFSSEKRALRAVRSMLKSGLTPSILEYLDQESVYCAEEIAGIRPFKKVGGKPLLLIEFDGSASELRRAKWSVKKWADDWALAFKAARDENEADNLWEVRRKCSGAMFALGEDKLNEDIVVPLESQLKLSDEIKRLRNIWKLPMPTFGHAADGNFHVNIMFDRADSGESSRAEGAVNDLMRTVVRLGGTISGEHGIGLAKSPFLRIARSEAEIAAMLAIKNALDPQGILNPGKVFYPYEVWDETPISVPLPWDKKPILKES